MKNDFYVYAWRRPDTGAVFYIGKGRAKRDISLKRCNPIFMSIINKLKDAGLSPVVERIRENLTESEAFDLERTEIAKHGRRDNGTGILANLTDGGEGASGAIVGAETRKKQSASLRGIPRTPEWLARMSTSLMGNRNSVGVKRSEETRAKMGAAQRGRMISQEARQKLSISVSKVVHRVPLRADNTSGYKGVAYCKERNKWQAGICVDGKRRSLGRFDTKEAAAKAYDKAARAIWGDACYLNFPIAANDNFEGSRIAA